MYSNPARLRPLVAFAGIAMLSAPVLTHAGGFALIEHGASGMGNAYAGAAAVSADTSTVWFNPAGMSEIQGREMAAGFHVLSSNTDYTDKGTESGYRLGGAPISGSDKAEPGTTSLLPNLYYVAPINDQWSYGLSIGVPFGSSTEYDSDWKGRYTTVKSGINVIDINPALSYQLSDKVRLGFGISLQQLTAELGSSIDSGAVCSGLAARPPGVPDAPPVSFTRGDCINAAANTPSNEPLLPGNVSNDSTAEITGDSIAYGFNLGALFLPAEGVKIGIAYRHSIDHELDGDAEFNILPALSSVLATNTNPESTALTENIFRNVPGVAKVELPATLSLSGAWQVNNKLELLSDLTWTGWSSFKELRVVYDNPDQADTLSLQEWEDVFRFSAGLNYGYSDKLMLRTGFAYDQEAIPSPQRRTARIPGNDRTWISFGLGYKVNNKFSIDVGYAHLFLSETAIDNPNDERDGAGTHLRGVFNPSVDILSAQINWDFN